jgi:hypothetical protein
LLSQERPTLYFRRRTSTQKQELPHGNDVQPSPSTRSPSAIRFFIDQSERLIAAVQYFFFSTLHGLYDGIVERLLKTANQGEHDGVLVWKILMQPPDAHGGADGRELAVIDIGSPRPRAKGYAAILEHGYQVAAG